MNPVEVGRNTPISKAQRSPVVIYYAVRARGSNSPNNLERSDCKAQHLAPARISLAVGVLAGGIRNKIEGSGQAVE